MPREQGAVCSNETDSGCDLEESELCSIHGAVKEHLPIQEGPAAGVAHLPGVQEATWHKQGDAKCEHAVSEDVENGSCTSGGSVREPLEPQEGPAARVTLLPEAQEATWHKQGDATCAIAVSEDVEDEACTSDGSVRKPLGPQGTSATSNEHKRNLKRFQGELFRSHPVCTALLILLLLVLVLALGVALAVLAAQQVLVTPATPLLVLGCPPGWVGFNGVCYYFSRDYGTWEQGQEWCSELGASLAIPKDKDVDLLFHLFGNGGFWLGLRQRGERLQWEDGSSSRSRAPVLGNSKCVYLADDRFRNDKCSNERPYLCSKAQNPL